MNTPNMMPRRIRQYGTDRYQQLAALLATGRAVIAWGDDTYSVMVDSALMTVPKNSYTTNLIRRYA